ncbi:hypothetical protein [Bacillus sp. JJ1562]|uniref:hypothetical protein n=1 Tax=Bacillus sp. JJ1562 TaxID=3122960 RepID=UPI0030021A1D
MNFKMQDKQNQLIERISDKHLIVGVDIAQHSTFEKRTPKQWCFLSVRPDWLDHRGLLG